MHLNRLYLGPHSKGLECFLGKEGFTEPLFNFISKARVVIARPHL